MNLFLTFFLVRIFYLFEKNIFSLKESKNDCKIFTIILLRGFCPPETEMTQFYMEKFIKSITTNLICGAFIRPAQARKWSRPASDPRTRINLYGSVNMVNNPRTANGPQIGPEMIPDRKWSPYWNANNLDQKIRIGMEGGIVWIGNWRTPANTDIFIQAIEVLGNDYRVWRAYSPEPRALDCNCVRLKFKGTVSRYSATLLKSSWCLRTIKFQN